MFVAPLHPVFTCNCGRVIHWPRNVRPGEQRVCFQCGQLWAWTPGIAPSPEARPTHYEPSRQPRGKSGSSIAT